MGSRNLIYFSVSLKGRRALYTTSRFDVTSVSGHILLMQTAPHSKTRIKNPYLIIMVIPHILM